MSPGTVKTHPKDSLEYVWIPPGTFDMGCVSGDRECLSREGGSPHRVNITKGFWLGQTEVTVGAYELFAEATSRPMPPVPDFNKDWRDKDHPINSVTWGEAQAYCTWVGGRLPTEAEWEYAARGDKEELKYPWGNSVSHDQANYGKDECCDGLADGRDRWVYTSPVGSFDPNGFNLFDMTGNVSHWAADWYDRDYYVKSPASNPTGPRTGKIRVARGGSWNVDSRNLRLSGRHWLGPGFRYTVVGFRCVGEIIP